MHPKHLVPVQEDGIDLFHYHVEASPSITHFSWALLPLLILVCTLNRGPEEGARRQTQHLVSTRFNAGRIFIF